MNKDQIKCLELLDSLVENDVDITNLAKEIPALEYHALRKRLYRAFGSQERALEAFGLFDKNGTPAEYELYRCFYIDDNYEVVPNDCEITHLCNVYNLNESLFFTLSKHIRNELRKDAVDEFWRNEFPDNIKSSVIMSVFPHIWNYIRNIYDGYGNMMRAYGTPSEVFVDYDYDRYNGEAIKDGHTFERIVKEVLYALYDDVRTQVIFKDCRPDFILGSSWIDAKLTLKSVYHQRSTTVSKYLKYTDDLTIIYAKGKVGSFCRDGANFAHISEFYPELRSVGRYDLVEVCEGFLRYLDEEEAIA